MATQVFRPSRTRIGRHVRRTCAKSTYPTKIQDLINDWLSFVEKRNSKAMNLFYKTVGGKKTFLEKDFTSKKTAVCIFLERHGITVKLNPQHADISYSDAPTGNYTIGLLGNNDVEVLFHTIEKTFPSVEKDLW